MGVFSFEDGTVFEGQFENDRACTKEGQVWGPAGRGLKLRILDLLEGVDNRQVSLLLKPLLLLRLVSLVLVLVSPHAMIWWKVLPPRTV